MNQNDILAQQQAILNQALHNSQQTMWGIIVVQGALLILTAWVIYMFYARLRDIADELRKFRISYDLAHSPIKPPGIQRPQPPPISDDSRYQPKK